MTRSVNTPVVLIVFNRPEKTRLVFDAIAKVRPSTLLVIADGPRQDRPGENELCQEVRDIVQRVDWPGVVQTNLAATNLGCRERVISGLNWAFSLVEEAIILEDDCLPDPSFFQFCDELLAKYRGDPRVAAISGSNLVAEHIKTEDSYYFSQLGGIWGWATWRSEWEQYDGNITNWPSVKRDGSLSEIFPNPKTVKYWTNIFDMVYEKRGPDTWDYQWLYLRLITNALSIVPRVNLVRNIGFGNDATHTSEEDIRLSPVASSISFPLRHPSSLTPLRSMDLRYQELYSTPVYRHLLARFKRIANRFLS